MPSIAWSPHRPERDRANGGTAGGAVRQANDPCPQQRVSGPSRGARGTARSPSPPDTGWSSRRHPGTRVARRFARRRPNRIRACAACMMWPAQPGPRWGPREGGPAVSTVLVVDDEERIRTLITRYVDGGGALRGHRRRRRRALDRLAAQGVDLVLLDLVMPRCHGLTVLSSLRQREDPTPVIVLSGVTDIAARVQALDRGAVDVVAKPFSLAELLARTRRHLARRPRSPGRPPVPHGRRHPARPRPPARHRGRPRGVPDRARVRAAGAPDAPARATCAAARSCCTTSGASTSTRAATWSRSASGDCATSCSRTLRSRRSAVSATASTVSERRVGTRPLPPLARRRGRVHRADVGVARRRDDSLPRRLGGVRAALRPGRLAAAPRGDRPHALHRGHRGGPRRPCGDRRHRLAGDGGDPADVAAHGAHGVARAAAAAGPRRGDPAGPA